MRRRSSYLDPDYRRAGWNTSRYAPKYGGPSITTVSARIAFLIIILAAFPAYKLWQSWAYQQVIDSYSQITYQSLANKWLFYGLVAIVVGQFVIQIITALILRRAEWKRIQRERARLEDEALRAVEEREAARRLRLATRPPLYTLSPRDFEYEVAAIIQAKTGLRAEVCGGKGDGGVDIRVYRRERLVGIVQCKRYDPTKTLPPAFVRELVTVRDEENVEIAYLVTTGRFSDETRAFARRRGVRLMDGETLEASRQGVTQSVFAPKRPAIDLPDSRQPSNVWRPPQRFS
jgi:hypothetical protein